MKTRGRSSDHVVSGPATDEEIQASDNKVIKDAYNKSRIHFMDRTSAGKALEGKKYRRGQMLTKESLLGFTPGRIVFVVASSLGQQAFVANEPMVLNSVDDKAATFLSERERVVFRLKDDHGRSHVSECWAIHDGFDVRLYDAVQVG